MSYFTVCKKLLKVKNLLLNTDAFEVSEFNVALWTIGFSLNVAQIFKKTSWEGSFLRLSQNENATFSVFVFPLCSVPFRFFFDYQTLIHINNSVWLSEEVWLLTLSVKCLPVLSGFQLLVSLQWEGKGTLPSLTFSSKVFKMRRIHNRAMFSASPTSFLCLFKCTLQIFLLFNDLLLCKQNNTASTWSMELHSLCKLLVEWLFLFTVLEYSTTHPSLTEASNTGIQTLPLYWHFMLKKNQEKAGF